MDEDVEEFIRKEVDRRVEERLERERTNQSSTANEEVEQSQNVSRRDFLKKLGLGSAALGATALLPSTSAVNIRTSNPLNYYGNDQNNPNFSVQPDGTLDAKQVNISSYSAKLERVSSDQSISADTNTPVNWNSQDIDTDIFSYDTSTDKIQVLASGNYKLYTHLRFLGLSQGELGYIKLFKNGSQVNYTYREMRRTSGGLNIQFEYLFKDLSQDDEVHIEAYSTASSDIVTSSFAHITKES